MRQLESELIGYQRPRLWSFAPYVSSAAAEAVEFGGKHGIRLDPWQEWLLYPSMGERADGKWAAGSVVWIVTRQNGKGAGTEVRELAGMYLFGEELLIHTAHHFKTSRQAFIRLLRIIEGSPDLDRRVAKTPKAHGEEGIELMPTTTIIQGSGSNMITRSVSPTLMFVARSETAARGFTADFLLYDEAMDLKSEDVGASKPALSARRNATPAGMQTWFTGSAGLGAKSSQLGKLRAAALAPYEQLRMELMSDLGEGESLRQALAAAVAPTLPEGDRPMSYDAALPGADPRLVFAEWSIDPHTDRCLPGCAEHDEDDIHGIRVSNPAYNIRIFDDGITDERRDMGHEEFRRERLGIGQYPLPGDQWLIIPKAWWEATKLADHDTFRPAQRVMAIDAMPNRQWTSIGSCGPRPDERFQLGIVAHEPGIKWVVRRAVELDGLVSPVLWVVDKRAAAGSLIQDLEDAGLTVISPSATDVGYACADLYDAFKDDLLRHDGNDAARKAMANVTKRMIGNQWAYDRPSDDLDLSPLMTLTLALWGWKRHAAEGNYDVRQSVGFDVHELIRLYKMGTYGPVDVERIFSRGALGDEALPVLAAAGIPLPQARGV